MKVFIPLLVILAASVAIAFSDTLTVTNTNDNGPGSLRQAIADASAGDTITFNLLLPAIIGLTSDELLIDRNLTISGPGAKSLTIEVFGGSGGPQAMEIAAGSLDVTITGLTIANGGFFLEGNGLFNRSTGAASIRDCVFDSNFGILRRRRGKRGHFDSY